MKVDFGECILGTKPFLYARDLLKSMGISGYFVDEYAVLDYLGYRTEEILPEEFPGFEEMKSMDGLDAIMIPKWDTIFVSKKMPKNRKRLTLFHEAGHALIPYHAANSYAMKKKDADFMLGKRIEREAFYAGSELMFPLVPFVNDSMSADISFNTIVALAKKYRGSVEATALRYAMTHQEPMAIVVVRKNSKPDLEEDDVDFKGKKQQTLFSIPISIKKEKADDAPLHVHYCCRSYRFPKLFIRPGTSIGENNIIYNSWIWRTRFTGQIPASVFNPDIHFSYNAECMRLRDGRIIVLLWLDKEQAEYIKGPIQ